MESITKFAKDELRKHSIYEEIEDDIANLLECNKINEFMTLEAAYRTLLLQLGKEDKMYRALLNKTYLFDIELHVRDERSLLTTREIKEKVSRALKGRFVYIYTSTRDSVHYIHVKLNDEAFNHGKIAKTSIPYILLLMELSDVYKIDDFVFNEYVFDLEIPSRDDAKYARVIEHLKSLKLPLSIIDDDVLFFDTSYVSPFTCYMYFETSDGWPKDQKAIDCAKAAFYCQIYKQSRYKEVLCKEYVVLKYKGASFKFKIILKQEKDVEYRMTIAVNELVKRHSDMFKENVVLIKKFLGCHGYYPIYLDDRFVEICCLIIGGDISSHGKFFNEFLSFDWDLEGKCFNLESKKLKSGGTRNLRRCFELAYKHDVLVYKLPQKPILSRLKMLLNVLKDKPRKVFDSNFKLSTQYVLEPNFSDFDFILSCDEEEGFSQIKNKESNNWPLGRADFEGSVCFKLGHKAYFFYSPIHNTLMVKTKAGVDPKLLAMVVLLETSFKYILFSH